MTCQEFQDQLHDYVDESLGTGRQTAAHSHLRQCPSCQLALQRVQTFGRAVEQALDEATSSISLQPALTQRILRAARTQQHERPFGLATARQWLAANPFRMVGVGGLLAGLLLFGLQFRRPAQVTTNTHVSYSFDVPYQTVTHVFEVQNGKVIDAAVTRVVAVDVHYSSYSSSARP